MLCLGEAPAPRYFAMNPGLGDHNFSARGQGLIIRAVNFAKTKCDTMHAYHIPVWSRVRWMRLIRPLPVGQSFAVTWIKGLVRYPSDGNLLL